ncbi:MAG: septal ring lytic transglycosylase RlpA family protein [Desulfohalobiaceae bacterium]
MICKKPRLNTLYMSKSSLLKTNTPTSLVLLLLLALAGACSVAKAPYEITKGTLKTTYYVGKYATKGVIGSGTVVYRVGEFTFKVAMAPLSWPMTREEIDSIDDMPPKEAIKKGRVKNSPYVVQGRRYTPMSVQQAKSYQERGMASWYGEETRSQSGGHMTANGEAFDPNQLTAAHKHLPLPSFVRVTNLDNNKSIIVRVNDRGPFVGDRIIDLSAGAAKRLGFYNQGLAPVLVETVETESG